MTNPYFDTYTPLPRDQLARAEALNAIFDALIVAFDQVPDAEAMSQDRLTFCTDTGAANAYAIAPTFPIDTYIAGQRYSFIALHGCTGPSTINVSGLGVKAIKRQDGSDLSASDITLGRLVWVQYDGTNFQLMTSAGSDVIASAASAAAAAASAASAAASASAAATSAAAVNAWSSAITVVPNFVGIAPGVNLLVGTSTNASGMDNFGGEVLAARGFFTTTNNGVRWGITTFLDGTDNVRIRATIDGANGVNLVSGANSWAALSVREAKTDFEPIVDPYGVIMAHTVELGRYKTDDPASTKRAFVFYEDAEQFWPSAVSYSPATAYLDENTGEEKSTAEFKGVAREEYVPLLMAAFQQQFTINAALEARLTALEAA